MKLQFYPIDISYTIEGGKPAIQLHSKTTDGKQIKVTYSGFEPYFWVINANEDELKRITVSHKEREIRITKTETHEKELLGRKVSAIKAYTERPADVPILRNELKKHATALEADIPYTRRFLTDNNITPLNLYEAEGEIAGRTFNAQTISPAEEALEELNILAFDIETLNSENNENPIAMIAFHGKNYKKAITWKRFKTTLNHIEFVESEAELIKRFQEIINEKKPDILTGYFSDGFDLPSIKTRAEKYKIKLELGPERAEIKITKGITPEASITGMTHLDIYQFIRRIAGRVLETNTYTLDAVSKEILKEGKQDADINNLKENWEKGEIEKYCEYNIKDAELTYRLAEKLMPNIIEMVKVTGLPIKTATRMSFSQLVEWHLIRRAPQHNQLTPNKPTGSELNNRMLQTYTGAFVYEPTPGIYKNVAVFDFRSLYPTIISAHNISPDTINCNCCKSEAELTPGEGKNWFCKKKKGFIAEAIKELIERRTRIKMILKKKPDEMLKARSEALKTIANSMYGYLGFFGARWYSIECARNITAYGRHYITQTIDRAKQEGFKVLYGDTDSVLLTTEGKKLEDAQKFIESINQKLPELMELEFEGYYPAGIFVATKGTKTGAKKKYALLTKEGTLKIKGFETIRRNTATIAREVQENVLRMALEGKKQEAVEYVKETIRKLRKKEMPQEKLIITTQLKKDTARYESIGPHVAAAKRMQEKRETVKPGMMISYIITAGKEKIRERAKLPQETEEGEYDAEYYINNQIIPAVKQILEVMGYDTEEMADKKEQSKLGEYMKQGASKD